jgi:hypothetical protein
LFKAEGIGVQNKEVAADLKLRVNTVETCREGNSTCGRGDGHRHELFLVLLEPAQDGIGKLAVHLDMAFAGQGEGVGGAGGTGVAEQAAKDVGEEIGEQLGFLEIVRAAGSDEVGPVLELGLPVRDRLREVEGPHLLADDLRMEERFGFESMAIVLQDGGAGVSKEDG